MTGGPDSHKHDIELLLAILAFHLQRHRLADEVRQHRETLRLLVEKHVDHLLRGEDAELARVELPRFAQEFAQNLVAHGWRRFEFAASFAYRAWLAQHVG